MAALVMLARRLAITSALPTPAAAAARPPPLRAFLHRTLATSDDKIPSTTPPEVEQARKTVADLLEKPDPEEPLTDAEEPLTDAEKRKLLEEHLPDAYKPALDPADVRRQLIETFPGFEEYEAEVAKKYEAQLEKHYEAQLAEHFETLTPAQIYQKKKIEEREALPEWERFELEEKEAKAAAKRKAYRDFQERVWKAQEDRKWGEIYHPEKRPPPTGEGRWARRRPAPIFPEEAKLPPMQPKLVAAFLGENTMSAADRQAAVLAETRKHFARHDTDTGSPEVQVAVLTRRIITLTQHLNQHKKDNHTRRGLDAMLVARTTHLKYLRRKDITRYKKLLLELGLKDRHPYREDKYKARDHEELERIERLRLKKKGIIIPKKKKNRR
mmetsp:Transcript_2787/g.9808  ORF Transcript_2787/g.9808 Transcript_2787/m.9808 type:complete len:384 (-) Transcript_2787:121-1272(-)